MDNFLSAAWSDIWPELYSTVVQPALTALAVYLSVVFKRAIDKVSVSIVDTQEKASVESVSKIQTNIMKELRYIVEAAVSESMKMANELKARNHDGQLTADQITDLRVATRDMINASLPDDLTDDGGTMKEIIGGEVALTRIIDSMVEQYVIEVKHKMATTSNEAQG